MTEEGKPVNRAGEGATLNGEGSSLLELVTDSWNGFFLCLRLCESDWLFVLTYIAFRNMHFINTNTQFRDVQAAAHKFSCQISESASLVLPCSSWWPADVAAEHSGGVLLVRGSLPSASLFPCGTSDCPSHITARSARWQNTHSPNYGQAHIWSRTQAPACRLRLLANPGVLLEDNYLCHYLYLGWKLGNHL